MPGQFSYSVLQYRHSIILGEAVNVGILFRFPEQQRLEFVSGNSARVKAIYPDFDHNLYNILVRNISSKIKQESTSLFSYNSYKENFKQFLDTKILQEDSTVLQFTDPVTVTHLDDNIEGTIERFSQLLLPGILTSKPTIIRHNESFLIRKFNNYIQEFKHVEDKLQKNRVIKTQVGKNKIQLKFDLSWEADKVHLIKPLSFDLAEEKAILDKSLLNLGYLQLLDEYARKNDLQFDFIVSKPQDPELFKSYDSAIYLLDQAHAPSAIIEEDQLKKYTDKAVSELQKSSKG